MSGRVVEIGTNGLFVSKYLGFLVINDGKREVARVALDEIEAVLVTTPGVSWSGIILAELASRCVPVVFLSPMFKPAAVSLPLIAHHQQSIIFRAQADMSLPARKSAWAAIVRRKIEAQAAALEAFGEESNRLKRLAKEVKSGDKTGLEGVAAAEYFTRMLGPDFVRDREEEHVNSMLNYGYAVLRGAAARSIAAAGLHPSLSLNHVSGGDALALADDLMEPFRPAVDIVVRRLWEEGKTDTKEIKRELAAVLLADYQTKNGISSLNLCLLSLARSLASSCQNRKIELRFPVSRIPIFEKD